MKTKIPKFRALLPWCFVKLTHPLTIDLERVVRLQKRPRWHIYDTRHAHEFNHASLAKAVNVNKLLIRLHIKKHDVRDHIILIGTNRVSNLYFVRWARHEGYKHIYASYYNVEVRPTNYS